MPRGKLRSTKAKASGPVMLSVLFWTGVAVVAFAPVSLILHDKSEAGWASLVCGVILMVASRFADIVELSIGPLKTKLDRQIAEAEQAMDAVRALAATTAETALSLVKMSGRLGGFTSHEEDEILKSFRSLMDELGIDQSRQDRVEALWHRVVEFDYALIALGPHTVPDGPNPEESKEWDDLRSGGFANRPTPESIRDFLNRTGYMNETSEEILKDYEYYIANKRHRRPEFWADRRKLSQFRLTRKKQEDAPRK